MRVMTPLADHALPRERVPVFEPPVVDTEDRRHTLLKRHQIGLATGRQQSHFHRELQNRSFTHGTSSHVRILDGFMVSYPTPSGAPQILPI